MPKFHPSDDSNEFEFEIIPTDEISSVRRGRKSTADPRLVEALKDLKPGRAGRVVSMRLDPTSPEYVRDKAAVSARIRAAAVQAGHAGASVVWTPDGVPQVRVK